MDPVAIGALITAVVGAIAALLKALHTIMESQQVFFADQNREMRGFMTEQQTVHAQQQSLQAAKYDEALRGLTQVVKDNTSAIARSDAINISTSEAIRSAVEDLRETAACPVKRQGTPVQNID